MSSETETRALPARQSDGDENQDMNLMAIC